MSKLTVKNVDHPLVFILGKCLILTDTETNKNVEIMAAQLKGIIGSKKATGSLPHGGWDKESDTITIYHDENRENHEVTFTLKELDECLN